MLITGENYTLHHGDCLEVMATLPAASVDAVICDPPYFNVVNEDWDKQWKTIEDYQQWFELLAVEMKRIAKPNGSIYIFGDDKTIAYVQIVLDKYFTLLNNLVWFKVNNMSIKAAPNLRTFAPMTERILFYEQSHGDLYCQDAAGYISASNGVMREVLPIGDLCETHRVSRSDIADLIKEDYKNIDSAKAQASNWILGKNFPNIIDFERLKTVIPIVGEYEDLRREYEDLRRTFNASASTLDVIAGPIVNQRDNTDHPTTKPRWIAKYLIDVSTNAGDTILDFTMGSGTFGVEAVINGRNFIGIDNGYCEKEGSEWYGRPWVDVAHHRIANASGEFIADEAEKAGGQLSLL